MTLFYDGAQRDTVAFGADEFRRADSLNPSAVAGNLTTLMDFNGLKVTMISPPKSANFLRIIGSVTYYNLKEIAVTSGDPMGVKVSLLDSTYFQIDFPARTRAYPIIQLVFTDKSGLSISTDFQNLVLSMTGPAVNANKVVNFKSFQWIQ